MLKDVIARAVGSMDILTHVSVTSTPPSMVDAAERGVQNYYFWSSRLNRRQKPAINLRKRKPRSSKSLPRSPFYYYKQAVQSAVARAIDVHCQGEDTHGGDKHDSCSRQQLDGMATLFDKKSASHQRFTFQSVGMVEGIYYPAVVLLHAGW